MMQLNGEMWSAIILAVISGGALTTLLNWLRDRKKDAATAKLTDVQTLQAKLAYVEGVAEYLQKHNDRLQEDYEASEERNRSLRKRVSELEIEVDSVRRSAAHLQAKCEQLDRKLREVMGEVPNE